MRDDWNGRSKTEVEGTIRKKLRCEVRMKCNLCDHEFGADSGVQSASDLRSVPRRAQIGSDLAYKIIHLVRDHNEYCAKRVERRRKREERAKKREEQAECFTEKHADFQWKCEKQAPKCDICGETHMMYPKWYGPCSHEIDKGASNAHFDKLTKEFRL
jgi:hypothetical protein